VQRTRTERIVPRPDETAPGPADRTRNVVPPDAVAAAARYDWRDAEKVGAAFRQWGRFLPAEVTARGSRWFVDHAAEMVGGEEALARLRVRIAGAVEASD
jgi:hypothetical protein